MLLSALFAVLPVIGAWAAPTIAARAAPTDADVLNYALTLEHLEANFYAQALAKFDDKAFAAAGYPNWVRGRISQIAQHEASHVKLLTTALTAAKVAPAQKCEYAFPLGDVKSFVGFATYLENIGVSAYAGANQYISDPLYSTVAATILSVEARHQGFLSGPVNYSNDWTGPYDTPLSLDMVYTLAAQVITKCPSTNPALPVQAFAPLTVGGAPVFAANAGQTISLTFDASKYDTKGKPLRAAIFNGLGSQLLDLVNNQITIPASIQGFSYVVITTAEDVTKVDSTNIVAGPAEVNTIFGDKASNPGFGNPYGA